MIPLDEALARYAREFPREQGTVDRFLSLLSHPDAYLRTHLPGHLTGSAFIVDEAVTKTVLVHHRNLNRWLQPGGHADGDTHLLAVARREAEEETGLTSLQELSTGIADLDIHVIPARKDFPEHLHFDVRFFFKASSEEVPIVSDESHDVKWIVLEKLELFNDEEALLRLRKKAGWQS